MEIIRPCVGLSVEANRAYDPTVCTIFTNSRECHLNYGKSQFAIIRAWLFFRKKHMNLTFKDNTGTQYVC